ncbi:protein ecm33 [Apiospora kogelbergensis]|uniref:Protein ecm33 n=1 Tax=Apiospora kogelbergensis TaxID=1337665 RepID=A0AAW0QF10_9PEZI
MQKSPINQLLLAWLLILGVAYADKNTICDSIIVHSQVDIDSAIGSGCSNIDGDVVLASDATGELSLDGINSIAGALRNENGSQVTAIRNQKIWQIDGQLILREMPKLETVSFRNLLAVGDWASYRTTVGQVAFENLGALSSLDLYELNILGEFHLVNLPLLKNFTQRGSEFGSRPRTIELRDIGVSNLMAMRLLNNDYRRSSQAESVTISSSSTAEHSNSSPPGGLHEIYISHNYTGRIDLDLDGDADVHITSNYVDRAAVSGARNLSIGASHAVGELVSSVANLDVQDCPAFERFRYIGNSWFDWTAPTGRLADAVASRSLVLRNLTSMYLHPDTTHRNNATDIDGAGHEVWSNGYCKYGGERDRYYQDSSTRCMGNLTSVVLEGNITNDFFEDFLFAFWSRGVAKSFFSDDAKARTDIRWHGRVTERFEITSTDPSFNCTAMDELRDVGLFPGKYSCNGKTAPMSRDAWAEAGKRSSAGGRSDEVVGSMLGLAVLLQLLLLF